MKHIRHEGTREREGGSSLIEMLLAFALISISLIVVADAYVSISRNSSATLRDIEVNESAMAIFDDMRRETSLSTRFTLVNTVPLRVHMRRFAGLNNDTERRYVTYTFDGNSVFKNVSINPTTWPPADWTTLSWINISGDLDVEKSIVRITTQAYNPTTYVSRMRVFLQAKHKDAGPTEVPQKYYTAYTERLMYAQAM